MARSGPGNDRLRPVAALSSVLFVIGLLVLSGPAQGTERRLVSHEVQQFEYVDRNITVYDVIGPEGVESETEFALVYINHSDFTKDVVITETIPKNIAQNASELHGETPFTVINPDPVIQFSFQNVREEQAVTATYSVGKRVDKALAASMAGPQLDAWTVSETETRTPAPAPATTPTRGQDLGNATNAAGTEPARSDGFGSGLNAAQTIAGAIVVIALIAGIVYVAGARKR